MTDAQLLRQSLPMMAPETTTTTITTMTTTTRTMSTPTEQKTVRIAAATSATIYEAAPGRRQGFPPERDVSTPVPSSLPFSLAPPSPASPGVAVPSLGDARYPVMPYTVEEESKGSAAQDVGKLFVYVLTEPLAAIEELAGSIVLVVVLVLLWRHQDRVLLVLTGDDRIHGNIGDFIWWGCFRCCGFCSHDWTRCLTRCCCPSHIAGANLVKKLGAPLGVSTHTLEVTDVVVGDLPWKGRGDFYISIACGSNPPVVTSVADDKPAKLVHFPEVITLRCRESFLETPVVMTVYQLDVVGSVELCSVHLSPLNVVQWARSKTPEVKRFAMVPKERGADLQTPPWIAVTFGFPRFDPRQLDRFHNDGTTVRTTTWKTGGTDKDFQDNDIGTFKHEYMLVDNGGNPLQEPSEDDIGSIARLRFCVYFAVRLVSAFLVVGCMCLVFFRLYAGSCYAHYCNLTQALEGALGDWNQSTPIPLAFLDQTHEYCEKHFAGMQIEHGTHPCRPSFKEVNRTCEYLPAAQKTPMAFQGIVSNVFGDSVEPLRCMPKICTMFYNLSLWDRTIFIFIFAMLIFTIFLVRPLANHLVEYQKHHLINQRTLKRQAEIDDLDKKAGRAARLGTSRSRR